MTEHDTDTDCGERGRLLCDLSALDAAQRERRFLLQQLLQVGTTDVLELPDGYAFQVDPGSIIAQHLEEFAALERLCCPFLTIAVGASAFGAQPVLEVGGGDAVKRFIGAQFAIREQ